MGDFVCLEVHRRQRHAREDVVLLPTGEPFEQPDGGGQVILLLVDLRKRDHEAGVVRHLAQQLLVQGRDVLELARVKVGAFEPFPDQCVLVRCQFQYVVPDADGGIGIALAQLVVAHVQPGRDRTRVKLQRGLERGQGRARVVLRIGAAVLGVEPGRALAMSVVPGQFLE